MHSFQQEKPKLPLGAVWLMNSISEYKGKQQLYEKQSPQVLRSLVEMALIESAESSNRIEGVTVEKDRLKPLVLGHSKPRDRSEEEVAGYRKALELIHTKHKSLEVTPSAILELHRLCRGESWDAGKWKEKDNDIVRKYPDGRTEVIFKPLPATQTPKAMEQLCRAYTYSLDQEKFPPLYAIACLILDFLCVHPFRDGNGRVGRLLTLLSLYQAGYVVGKYISLERIIEQTKETYYESLNKSSQRWHQGKHNVMPWFHYFLGSLLAAYKEFEERAENIQPARGTKTGLVIQAVENQIGEFTMAEIEKECLSVSRDMIRLVFRRLQKEKKIRCLGKGKSAKWRKVK